MDSLNRLKRRKNIVAALGVAVISCCPIFAWSLEDKCKPGLSWKDATHLQKTTYQGSVVGKAEWKKFSNLTWMLLETDGRTEYAIQLADKYYLTYGQRRPKPSDFAAIATVVESPMWESNAATMKRFPHPCALKNGENIPFNEADFVFWSNADSQRKIQIFGSLKRQAYRVHYSMEMTRGKSDQELDKLFGVWEFQPQLETFSVDFDVQGWHVFRGDVLVRSLPVGQVMSLGKLLGELQ